MTLVFISKIPEFSEADEQSRIIGPGLKKY